MEGRGRAAPPGCPSGWPPHLRNPLIECRSAALRVSHAACHNRAAGAPQDGLQMNRGGSDVTARTLIIITYGCLYQRWTRLGSSSPSVFMPLCTELTARERINVLLSHPPPPQHRVRHLFHQKLLVLYSSKFPRNTRGSSFSFHKKNAGRADLVGGI